MEERCPTPKNELRQVGLEQQKGSKHQEQEQGLEDETSTNRKHPDLPQKSQLIKPTEPQQEHIEFGESCPQEEEKDKKEDKLLIQEVEKLQEVSKPQFYQQTNKDLEEQQQ